MSTDGKRESKLIRVGGPLIRVKLTFPPLDPSEGPVTDGPLIRVGGPLIRVKMTFKPADPVRLELAVGLRPEADPAGVSGDLNGLVDALNADPAGLGGAGFRVDPGWAGPGVGLVLVPNDPAGTEDELRRAADLLAAAAGGLAGAAGAVVRVISAADPDRPLYEAAA